MALATSRKGKERAIETHEGSDVAKHNSAEDGAANSSSSQDSEQSDSSSSSSSDNESSEYDSDFAPPDPAYMKSLVEKAKANMAAKAAQKPKAVFLEADEIRLDDGIEEIGDSNECVYILSSCRLLFSTCTSFVTSSHLPRLDPGPLPPRYIEWEKNKKAGPSKVVRDMDTDRLEKSVKSVSTPALPPPAATKADGSKLTKKERKSVSAGQYERLQ